MTCKVFAIVLVFVVFANSHPTMYKLNDNLKLEPDLVPVSSTVIPIPVYKVAYGVNVGVEHKDVKITKPEGPVTLLTVHNKKKGIPTPKAKYSDVSSVKQISKTEFDN